jgi:hypothetical protein
MNYAYDKIYIRAWGSSGAYQEFPYSIDGVNNTLPEFEAGQNDVDLDAYTNTKGKTIRGRVRHDVKTLDFNIPVMTGTELKKLLEIRSPEWFECVFFDEAAWGFVSKKMYCSSPKYHKYIIDTSNPLNNVYTDIQFGFVEQ